MRKKRHLTPQEIMAQCNMIARERRMAERTPWTAVGIICAYVIMKREGFKGKRISKIVREIDHMEAQWDKGETDLQKVSDRLYEKSGWSITNEKYTEADIRAKKGSYQYWLDSVQIEPQNTINETATRYMLFFFTVLMDEYGFGKDRLTRVQDYMNELLLLYQQDKTSVHDWKKALYDEAGVVFEMPIDPLTQTAGSLMTN